MSANMLPIELVEFIMEPLLDDKSTLSQCSLVCQQWSLASSRYLFASLCLQPQTTPHSPSDWYETLLLALQSSPRISKNVRELVFFSKREANAPPVRSSRVLQHILSSLPLLRIFKLNDLDFNESSKASEFVLGLPSIATPLKLEKIELQNVLGFSTYHGRVDEYGTPDSFGLAEFLNLFDEVRELRFDNSALPFTYAVNWHLLEAIPKPLGRPEERPLRLQRVHLIGQPSAKALGVLQRMINMRELKELSLQLSPSILGLANEFLSHAVHLEHIHITLRRGLTSSQEHAVPALVRCSQLRTIRLSSIAFLPRDTSSEDIWQRAMEILQCAPPSLQRVVLDVVLPATIAPAAPDMGIDSVSVVPDLNWGEFNATLLRADQLEEVLLLAAHRFPWTKSMQVAVQAKLSDEAQKLLQFGTFARS